MNKPKRKNFFAKLMQYFNLDHEIDNFELIDETIRKDSEFKGTNLLVLIFAILIASVGLNMNSTAVIIGAMLISPLMGPINAMGYSIATYDSNLFKIAVKNFLFAVAASLLTSTVYFWLSPISTAHSELLARTSPTIYDVLIAFFGGLAGILAISSKQKGNVIPGVAIATALMPPLCTAGYGLATGNLLFFFGAIYLFTINTVFIAISSVVMSQILKFPIRTVPEEAQKKKINRLISAVIILILIPSLYFGFNLVKKEKFTEQANKYVNAVSIMDGVYLLRNEINPTTKTITLVYGGEQLTEEQKTRIKDIAGDFTLSKANIEFKQGLQLENRASEVEYLKAQLNMETFLLKEKEKQLENSLNKNRETGEEIFNEIKTLYPQIKTTVYAKTLSYEGSPGIPTDIDVIVFSLNDDQILSDAEKETIHQFLSKRIKSKNLKVLYE